MTNVGTRVRRRVLAVALIGGISATVAGCAPGGGGGDAADGDTGTLTIGVEAGSPWEVFYGDAAERFAEETGIEVELLPVPHANMRDQFLSDAVAGAGSYDVFTVDQPWLPEFAQNGYLVQIDDRISDEDRDDFAQTLDTMSHDDQLYGLPYMVHNTVLYYRTDLFEAAGLPGPPTTWEEYREYARILTDEAAGVYGTIIPGKQDGEVATRFQSFIQQAGGDIVDEEGAPTIDTPEARAAFELMTAIQFEDGSSPEGLHDLTEIQGQFLEGNVAMVPVWPYLYSLADDPAQSKVAGNFAIALSPGSPDQVSTVFAWGFGINAASDNVDGAWQWLEFATSPEILQEISLSQFAPVPRSSVADAVAEDESLTEAQRDALAVFAESVSLSETMPMTPLYSRYQEAMAVAVSAVMSGASDVDAALAAAQADMDAAYAETQ